MLHCQVVVAHVLRPLLNTFSTICKAYQPYSQPLHILVQVQAIVYYKYCRAVSCPYHWAYTHYDFLNIAWCQLNVCQCADDSVSDLEVVLEEDLNGVACKLGA